MVTTESRTEATTAVSSGALGAVVAPATVTAAGATRGGPAVEEGASGPATSAAVPPAARTADRTAAMTTDVGPRREPPARRGAEVVTETGVGFGGVTGVEAGVHGKASAGAGAQAGGGVGADVGVVEVDSAEAGVSGCGGRSPSFLNIGSSDRAGGRAVLRSRHFAPRG
jgi:hypothetical protein